MADHYVGELCAFPFGTVPDLWYPCDGRLLPVDGNDALYAVIGNTYGGDMFKTFALPDLRGTTAVGAGAAAGGVNASGSAGSTIAVNWCIAHGGLFPVRQ